MWVGILIRFVIMIRLWRRYIARPKGATIRGLSIKVVSVGGIITYNSEELVLRVGTLRVNCIIIRVSLVGSFRPHFKLLIEVSLVLVIVLVSVMDIL